MPLHSHYSSETPKVDHIRQKTPVKALRHENSGAVWNELALYRGRCQELESHLYVPNSVGDVGH